MPILCSVSTGFSASGRFAGGPPLVAALEYAERQSCFDRSAELPVESFFFRQEKRCHYVCRSI